MAKRCREPEERTAEDSSIENGAVEANDVNAIEPVSKAQKAHTANARSQQLSSGPSNQLVTPKVSDDGVEYQPDWQAHAVAKHTSNIRRTSSLRAPTHLLEGHSAAVYSLRFAPSAHVLASGAHDRLALLWSLSGNCASYLQLEHPSPVLEVHWSHDSSSLLTCSPDKAVRLWDAEEGELMQDMRGHRGIVNTCCISQSSPHLALSGSDDRTCRVWDTRSGESVQLLQERYQVLASCFSEDNTLVFAAGIEECVRAWDLRKANQSMVLRGHADTITGMQLSPDGGHLLTNSADNTLAMWDVKPLALESRHEQVFVGHAHNFERNLLRCAWSADGSRVTAGSSDRMVYVWDAESGKLQYKLPGHAGAVNECAFHPREPIIASASSDTTIFIGELDA